MKVVSIHIPKTGGTAVREAIETAHRLQTYYYQPAGAVDPEVFHGHIRVSQARRRFPGVPVVAVIRHPYEQIRSNYDHYRHHPRTRFEPGIGRIPQGLTFEQFITLPKMANYQSQFLDGPVDLLAKDPAELAAVANRLYRLEIPVPALRNVTRGRTRITGRHRALIDQHHGEDLRMWGT